MVKEILTPSLWQHFTILRHGDIPIPNPNAGIVSLGLLASRLVSLYQGKFHCEPSSKHNSSECIKH